MTKSRISKFIFLTLFIVHCSLFIGPAVSQSSPPDPRFGAVEAFRDPIAAAEAGVGWERVLFYWSELQPNGLDDWNGYHVPDEWLAQAIAAGREMVAVLKHTPAWATDGLPGCGVPRGLELPLDDPGNLWAAFVRRAVGIYAGRINHWIVWNEPDITPGTHGAEWCGTAAEYYQLLKVAYLAAHQANPDVTIHLAGTTTWHDKTYLRRLLEIGMQDPTGPEHGYYFDVATVHVYFQTETVSTIINETRATLAAYGLQKSIWVNETNAPPDSDPLWPLERLCWRVSLEEQAGFLLQSFALALVNGVERVAVYKWLDYGLPPGSEPFGVLRPDGSRRPAFDAYKLITTHYTGAISGREDRQSLYTLVTLDRGELTTRVLWTRTQAGATVSVSALAPQARLIDQTGAEQVVEPVDGQYALTLPGARCPAERSDCPVQHPVCIIGGPTYLLVEEAASSALLLVETSVPAPTETPTPLPTATPVPTETPTPTPAPTDTPSPTPTATAIPTPTSTLTPTATSLPPTPTLLPPVLSTSDLPLWSMLVGFVTVTLSAAVLVGVWVKRRG